MGVRVLHLHHPAVHRQRAQRVGRIQRLQVDADAGLEPLTPLVDETDGRHGHAAQPRGQPHQLIESLLHRGVQHRAGTQRFEAFSYGSGLGRHAQKAG